MKKLIALLLFIGLMQTAYTQEEETEWKPQTFVTGYFSFNGEYIDLSVFEEVKGRNFGVGIAEASVLTTIRPLKKLKINAVITYKPRLHFDRIIAELSGEWSFSEQFKIKAGRFILPLHPANSQYFAPMNYGVALPIFVTNRALFPININGINFNGNISLSDNLSLCYNFSGGQYTKLTRVEAGILGFFGRDGVYLNENIQQVNTMIAKIESEQNGEYPDYFGAGGKMCLTINEIVKFGVAGFYGDEEVSAQVGETTYKTDLEFISYGTNFLIDYNNLHIKGSAWFGAETPVDTEHFETYNNKFYYSEMAYSIDKITPFIKYENLDGRKIYSRATAGINYRPFFETTFKLEYHRYLQDYIDNFSVFQFSAVYSF